MGFHPKPKNVGCRVTAKMKEDFKTMCEIKEMDESEFLTYLIDKEWNDLENIMEKQQKRRERRKKNKNKT